MGDDWSLDLWDELVANKPEHWDIRDALRLRKRESHEDPSSKKKEQPRVESPTSIRTRQLNPNLAKQSTVPETYMDARGWVGQDLNQAVERLSYRRPSFQYHEAQACHSQAETR